MYNKGFCFKKKTILKSNLPRAFQFLFSVFLPLCELFFFENTKRRNYK